MSDYAIGPASQIPAGEGRNFMVAERLIAVFRIRDGEMVATQAECPHRRGPLADGPIDARVIVCPLHDHMFSMVTGAGIGNDCAITVYPVRVSGSGQIVLTIESDVEAVG